MLQNISDPNIAAGFQALMSAFVPNAGSVIDADLARVKRDGMLADTARTNVDATRLAADRARLQAEADRTTGYIAADQQMAAILSDPAFNPSDPAWRAKLAAAAATTQNGLKDGPGALTGFTTYVDPNFAGSAQDFSNILMGTGVVSDYANTPSGFQTAETNDLTANGTNALSAERIAAGDNQRALAQTGVQTSADIAIAGANNQAEMDRLKYETTTPRADGATTPGKAGAGATPPTVDPGDVQKFAEIFTARVATAFPNADLTDQQAGALMTEAMRRYQITRNADAAIADVLSGYVAQDKALVKPLTGTTASAVGAPRASGQGGEADANLGQDGSGWGPSVGLNGTVPSVGWTWPWADAPAAPSASAAPSAPPVRTATHPGTGQKVYLDPVTNTWKPLGPVRGQP